MQIQKKRNTKALQGFGQIAKNKYKYKNRELQKPNLPGVYIPTISAGSAIPGSDK